MKRICIKKCINVSLFLTASLLVVACEKSPVNEVPPAQTLTREANGYYCLMTVLNHKGPKGQIILTDKKVLWFTSVSDTIAFTLSPEEPKNIAAIYVNDMTDASWDNPGEDNWIDATKAWYVLNTNLSGGMGAAEKIPFATKEQAELFASKNKGVVSSYSSLTKK